MLSGRTFHNLKREETKGDNGIVLVIGGSALYTGAPIFSAKAALRSGADMVYIMCPEEASVSVKALHEAIVLPIEKNERILSRITACIIGPGLGRIDDGRLRAILEIAEFLGEKNIPIVIDADAIHYYKQGYFNDIRVVIITPNCRERAELSVTKSHICIQKGKSDRIIANGFEAVVEVVGSDKRCGGLGDILNGILATAVSLNPADLLDACISACEIAREASRQAFLEKGYSMITSDVIERIFLVLKEFEK